MRVPVIKASGFTVHRQRINARLHVWFGTVTSVGIIATLIGAMVFASGDFRAGVEAGLVLIAFLLGVIVVAVLFQPRGGGQ